VDLLQFLSSCEAAAVVDGETHGLREHDRLCGSFVYLSWSESVNEEFA